MDTLCGPTVVRVLIETTSGSLCKVFSLQYHYHASLCLWHTHPSIQIISLGRFSVVIVPQYFYIVFFF